MCRGGIRLIAAAVAATVMALSASLTGGPAHAGEPSPGPVVWYEFDEGTSAATAVNAANPGTYNGANTGVTTGVAGGQIGKCYDFDGAGDYVEVPDLATWNGVTVATWINVNVNPTGLGPNSIIHTDAYSAGGFHFQLDHQVAHGGKLGLYLNGWGEFSSTTGFSASDIGSWVHVAVTYDSATGTATFYRDGQPDGGWTGVAGRTVVFSLSRIGMWKSGDERYLDAKLDDLRIYDRALDAPEVLALYNGGGAAAPTITTQPTDQSVIGGDNATFTCAATGDPAPGYQWYEVGVGLLSGKTASALTILATVPADDGRQFYCVASNGVGADATSNAVTLTVIGATPPSITVETPRSGQTVSGTVTIQGTAEDNAGVAAVEVSVDGGPFRPAGGTAEWSFVWGTSGVEGGEHTITVRATDAGGLTSEETLTVNLVPSPFGGGCSAASGRRTPGALSWLFALALVLAAVLRPSTVKLRARP